MTAGLQGVLHPDTEPAHQPVDAAPSGQLPADYHLQPADQPHVHHQCPGLHLRGRRSPVRTHRCQDTAGRYVTHACYEDISTCRTWEGLLIMASKVGKSAEVFVSILNPC